eukprot:8582231-Alexandrium_andersonii.AAC.1
MASAAPAIASLAHVPHGAAVVQAELHREAAQLEILRRQVGDEERTVTASGARTPGRRRARRPCRNSGAPSGCPA